MKTIAVNIYDARSLEHAMDKAIEEAEAGLSTQENNWRPTHRLTKVTFKTVEVHVGYREKDWTYRFEAELEEL